MASDSSLATASCFRAMLPRVYELKDTLTEPTHPDAYFRDFEQGLEHSTSKRDAFLKLEGWLSALDAAAWTDLKTRAAVHLIARNRESGRGWQALFDVLSEARAFRYLKEIGCADVGFVPRAKNKNMMTPDLAATQAGRSVYCEVKTINVSQEEASRRRRIQNGEVVAGETCISVEEGFLLKLTGTLAHAVEQLDAADPGHAARRIVFTMLYFDDWVGDYQPQYIAQIDGHLLQHPVAGAELVFCLGNNLFERAFAMKSATILSA
jgi:hypothetical protein